MSDNAIWKFILPAGKNSEILVPLNAKMLSVGLQNNVLHAWFIVDPKTNSREYSLFEIYLTGENLKTLPEYQTRIFISTLIRSDGIVLHIFKKYTK